MKVFDFDDLFDWFWFGFGGFGGEEEPEEVKKAREKLRKAREEYYEVKRKAWEKRMEELKKASESKELALPSTTLIPFGGSEEEFQAAVERFARAHPDARVEAKSIAFPNGYYRSIRIEKKRTS